MTQTASNNDFLAGVKTLMSVDIYKHARSLVNAQGEDAAIGYLQTRFACHVSRDFFTSHESVEIDLDGEDNSTSEAYIRTVTLASRVLPA